MKDLTNFLVTPKESSDFAWRRPALFDDMTFIVKTANYATARVINKMKKRNMPDDPAWVKVHELHAVFMAGYMQGKREERQRRKRAAIKRP